MSAQGLMTECGAKPLQAQGDQVRCLAQTALLLSEKLARSLVDEMQSRARWAGNTLVDAPLRTGLAPIVIVQPMLHVQAGSRAFEDQSGQSKRPSTIATAPI
jgi:hypothetical protein